VGNGFWRFLKLFGSSQVGTTTKAAADTADTGVIKKEAEDE
jgi:hypothetical protein